MKENNNIKKKNDSNIVFWWRGCQSCLCELLRVWGASEQACVFYLRQFLSGIQTESPPNRPVHSAAGPTRQGPLSGTTLSTVRWGDPLTPQTAWNSLSGWRAGVESTTASYLIWHKFNKLFQWRGKKIHTHILEITTSPSTLIKAKKLCQLVKVGTFL